MVPQRQHGISIAVPGNNRCCPAIGLLIVVGVVLLVVVVVVLCQSAVCLFLRTVSKAPTSQV